MLKITTNIAVYSTYLIVVGFLGYVLWQSLFSSTKIDYSKSNKQAAETEQQHVFEQRTGGSASPSAPNSADEAITLYTKWLAVFTALLVLATVALFVSGERNVEAAREAANAANDTADAAKRTFISTNRPKIIVRQVYFEPNLLTPQGVNSHALVWYILSNTGATEGKIIESSARLEYWDMPHAEIAGETGGQNELGPIAMQGGETIRKTWPSQPMMPQFLVAPTNPNNGLFFIARFVYVDLNGVRRETSVYRRYDPATERFNRVDNPELDYSD